MGMNSMPYYMSWIIWYMIVGLITAIIVTLILVGSVFPNSDPLVLILFYWFFTWSLIA